MKSNREFYPTADRFADTITNMKPDVVADRCQRATCHVDIETARAFVPGSLPT